MAAVGEPTPAAPGRPQLVGAQVGLLIAIWGTTYAAIRIGLETMPPFLGIAVRFAIAGAVLIVGCRLAGIEWRRDGNLWGLWTFNAVTHFAIPYGVVYWAEQWLSSGLAAVLFTTFPLFVAVLAHWLVPGERLRPLAVVGVLLGVAGVAVIYSDDLGALADPQTRLAAWVFLASPIAAALGDVVIKRSFSHVHPVSLTAPCLLITAVITGALALGFEDVGAADFGFRSWAVLLYLALVGTSLAFVVYFRLLSRVTVTALSLITFGIPIVALAVGALLLDETVTPRVVAGAALVLAGVWAALRRRPR